jgi:hypothetical protein
VSDNPNVKLVLASSEEGGAGVGGETHDTACNQAYEEVGVHTYRHLSLPHLAMLSSLLLLTLLWSRTVQCKW